jgi:uncharacterized Fe-S center protein
LQGDRSLNTPSKVFFTDLRTQPGRNLLDKYELLIKKAGIEKIDFKNKFTAIKMHFGEPGNLAFIRPNYAAGLVKKIRALDGKPYLTDCNTLYFGARGNAVDHLQAAIENGFNYLSTGANVIIADGLSGGDAEEIPINLKHVKNAKVGTVLAQADVIVSLTHFKGHEATGFGGTLKNVGMHSSSKPKIVEKECVECGTCIRYCPQKAIEYNARHKAQIDYDLCIGCGQCIASCHYGAARGNYDENAVALNEKIAEYAYAILKDKPQFHISLIMNVSPNCDCWDNNDMAIVPDIGMAASFDPVALDRACVDLVNRAIIIPGSLMAEKEWRSGDDKFNTLSPNTRWQDCLKHAEEIGLGTQNYELITIK